MKKPISYYLFLIFLSISIFLSLISCKESNTTIQDENEIQTTAPVETLSESEFITFGRFNADKTTKYYSFLIPSSWVQINENYGFDNTESFFNNEKTKYIYVSFTDISNLQKMDIKNAKSDKDFKNAINKLIKFWEKSGFVGNIEKKDKSFFIADSDKTKAYLSEYEGSVDFGNAAADLQDFEGKVTGLIYVCFIQYENKYIGYYALVDRYSDRDDDLNIVENFADSLEINSIYQSIAK